MGGTGSCDGDSGGPIVQFVTDDTDPHYVQLGIVQGGIGRCGSRSFPGIYVRIGNDDILRFIVGTAGIPGIGNCNDQTIAIR